MTLLVQFDDVHREETRREALSLVAGMMRYRQNTIADLEGEIHDAILSLHGRGMRRRLSQSVARLATLTNRVQQMARDNRYDAVLLASILQVGVDEKTGRAEGDQSGPVTYIT